MYLLKISVLHSLLNGDIKKDNICPKWWLPVAERILGGIISAEGIVKNGHKNNIGQGHRSNSLTP